MNMAIACAPLRESTGDNDELDAPSGSSLLGQLKICEDNEEYPPVEGKFDSPYKPKHDYVYEKHESEVSSTLSFAEAPVPRISLDWEHRLQAWEDEETLRMERSFLPPLLPRAWDMENERPYTCMKVPAEVIARELKLSFLPRFQGVRRGLAIQAPEDVDHISDRDTWVEYMADIYKGVMKERFIEVKDDIGSQEAFEWLMVFKAIDEWGYDPLFGNPNALELLAYLMQVPVNKLKIKIQLWKEEVSSYVLRKMTGSSTRDARAWGYRVLSMAEHLLADMEDILYVIVEESMSGRVRMEEDYPPRRTGDLDQNVKEGVPMICQWEDVGSEEDGQGPEVETGGKPIYMAELVPPPHESSPTRAATSEDPGAGHHDHGTPAHEACPIYIGGSTNNITIYAEPHSQVHFNQGVRSEATNYGWESPLEGEDDDNHPIPGPQEEEVLIMTNGPLAPEPHPRPLASESCDYLASPTLLSDELLLAPEKPADPGHSH
jgi:hypothetical protein